MSDSESNTTTDDPYEQETPHGRSMGFDTPQKHAMLAMRDGDDIAVWVEYDGKSLARADGRSPSDGDGGLSIHSPTCAGETLHDLPDGYAAVLWSNHPVGDGVYCFGCETLYENEHDANTHHDPHTCEPFTPAIEVIEREVPRDD
jgi:hypothetical protein